MKPTIYTTLLPGLPRWEGRGETARVSLRQQVHSGPKPVMDRRVELVMLVEEAADLAYDILALIPISALQDLERVQMKLRKLLTILDGAKKEGS